MHRHPGLRPFSRDHHHVLALARRLTHATTWTQAEAEQLARRVREELAGHMALESGLLPALEADDARELAAEIHGRHTRLQSLAEAAVADRVDVAHALGAALVEQVRWEERVFLPWCEAHLPESRLSELAMTPPQVRRGAGLQPLPRLAPATELTPDVLRTLVDVFYARVRADDLLGPIFERIVENWPAHLAKLTAFWCRVMLGTAEYTGNPMTAHMRHRGVIGPAHFQRWLGMWKSVTEEVLSPPLAAAIQERAERMAQGLMAGLDDRRGGAALTYDRGLAEHADGERPPPWWKFGCRTRTRSARAKLARGAQTVRRLSILFTTSCTRRSFAAPALRGRFTQGGRCRFRDASRPFR